MAPCKSTENQKLPLSTRDNDIVISGISGRFPESRNMQELYDNLMTKHDMISDDDRRWSKEVTYAPHESGKIGDINKFDAHFFGIHPKQVEVMDPMSRMVLEHAYEAIVDAGLNPKQLRGTKTGVFFGNCYSESESAWIYQNMTPNGLSITGNSRSMFANRISYWLNARGPSYTLDTGCSSSHTGLEHAYRAIKGGICDAAIVAGSNLCLLPSIPMHFTGLGVLAADGRCKSFDKSADGFVRSEAVCAILVQRAKDAKRMYARVVHMKASSEGYKEQGITFPLSSMQSQLFRECYAECGVPASSVNYVEGHGTGTIVGDAQELESIDSTFGHDRTPESPLLIGSVKSNLGHSEAASGLVALAKVLLAMESGTIAPNLHFKECRSESIAMTEGRIKVVTEPTAWDGPYAAINNFGMGGSNVHTLLERNPKDKVINEGSDNDLPRLVAVSGRTEEAVTTILEYLESRPVDVDFVGLLHNIHSDEINGHLFRGYTLLPPRGTAEFPINKLKFCNGAKRPVWFVFSGMGSQWIGMGGALLRLPVFAEAIKKCHLYLKPFGIDIFQIISTTEKTVFNEILNRFIAIVAIQIGLVDVLKSLGIEPDNVIGHSFGELSSSYADGSLTVEQTILSAYFRGLVSIEMKPFMIRGAMAAVGLGYEKIKDICPPDIDIACHNSAGSVTISGPDDSIKKFVAELKTKQIFVKDVDVCNIAYHSRYIADAGPKLRAYLKEVIPDPKPRSSKWVSSSVPMDKWGTDLARYSSAEYHTNNFLNSVLFEEASALIPIDAVVIEIAPHGLLQSILKRSFAPTVANIQLMRRGHEDNVSVFFQAIGDMFNEGLQPQLDKLYPAVSFPVSRGTAMISPLIKWDHTQDWFVLSHKAEGMGSGERDVTIDFVDSDYRGLLGHVVDGRNIFPAAGYLKLIWETYGMMNGKHYIKCPVVFEDVKFLSATTIPKNGQLKFRLMIQKGTGRFEVTEGESLVAAGLIRGTSRPKAERVKPRINLDSEEESMTSRDVYKRIKLCGFEYTGSFRGITRAATSGAKAHVRWQNDWLIFLDNVMQLKIINVDSSSLLVPSGIRKIIIDTDVHYEKIQNNPVEPEFEVTYDKLHDMIDTVGVQIFSISLSSVTRRKPARDPVVEEHKFVPFLDEASVSLREISRLSTHIAVENNGTGVRVKTVELLDEADQVAFESLLSPWISESLGDSLVVQADIAVLTTKNDFQPGALPDNVSVIEPCHSTKDATALLAIGHRLLAGNRSHNLSSLLNELKPGGFVLSRETDVKDVENAAQRRGLCVILIKKVANEIFVLLRVRQDVAKNAVVINVCNDKFDWIEKIHKALAELEKEATHNTRIFLVGQGDVENGLMGLVNCLKREPGGEFIRGVLIQDSKAPAFSLRHQMYAQQAKKDLVMCVLRAKGIWGTYRHLPLPAIQPKPVQHGIVYQLTHGDLSSLTWMEGAINPEEHMNNVIKIVYASLNFRDVMFASGKLAVNFFLTSRQAGDCVIGTEYSGIDNANKKVMGIIVNCAFSNLCIPDRLFTWEIPDSWSLEDAATVPIAYITCVYAFYMKTTIRRGQKILIHVGAGAVGQAAINMALAEGCEVFTTVGTPEKRKFIRDHFPQIRDDHIGNSRDTSFEQMIKEQTDGQGVDFVLNSLGKEKLLASVRCLARGGHFLEIGKFDLLNDNPLGMNCFLKDITFHGVITERLLTASDDKKLKTNLLIKKYLKSGAIKPLVRKIFSRDQVEAAFRYLMTGKHIGKVMIRVREQTDSINTKILAIPQYYCLKNRSYIILGGLGGFGLELADWLVLRGAETLVITSRTGIKNGYQKMKVDLWKSYGVNVLVVSGKDASSLEDCRYIIETAANLAPVDGIFNLAVLLRDAMWNNQTAATFEESFRPKAWATKNLDILTRKLCPQLRHFVVFSSVSCGRGSAGQTNYGMSNSAMERICEKRVTEGLPGLAIQWGAIGDVGIVADMQEDGTELVIGGAMQQSISSCLQELNGFLCQSRPIVSSMVVAENKVKRDSVLNVVDAVLGIMGMKNLKEVRLSTTLSEMGMDSMMAAEVKQTLERNYKIFLNNQDVQNLTFTKLKEMAITKTVAKASSGPSSTKTF